jgi:hypothetical protein
MSDDYGTPLGVGTLHYETDIPTVHAAPKEYAVRNLGIGPKRTHYAVTIPSVSGDPARVSVHRTSGNISCLTHNTANRCEHVAALKEHLASNPLPSVA